MKQNFKHYAIVWGILLALFTLIAMICHFAFDLLDLSFWGSYVLIVLACVGQLFVAKPVLAKTDIRKMFFSLSLIQISWAGMIASMIMGTLCLSIPLVPAWIGALLVIIITAVEVIALVGAHAAVQNVEETEEKIKSQTSFIRSLTVEAKNLCSYAKDETAKESCERVYEAIRYSDPMSHEGLTAQETVIREQFDTFSVSVREGKQDVQDAAEELLRRITARNNTCKLFK